MRRLNKKGNSDKAMVLLGFLILPMFANCGPKVSGALNNTSIISQAINSATNSSGVHMATVDVLGDSLIQADGSIVNDSIVDDVSNNSDSNSRAVLGGTLLEESDIYGAVLNQFAVGQSRNSAIANSVAIMGAMQISESNIRKGNLINSDQIVVNSENIASDNSIARFSSVDVSGLNHTRDMLLVNGGNTAGWVDNLAEGGSSANIATTQINGGRIDGTIYNVDNDVFDSDNAARNESFSNVASVVLDRATRMTQGANVQQFSEPPFIRYLVSGDITNSLQINEASNLAENGSRANAGSIDILVADVTGSINNSGSTTIVLNHGSNESVANTGSIVIGY